MPKARRPRKEIVREEHEAALRKLGVKPTKTKPPPVPAPPLVVPSWSRPSPVVPSTPMLARRRPTRPVADDPGFD